MCSTWVHPSTAPSHQQGVSIWRDSTPSLPFSKGQTPSFYSCKLIRRLLLVFSSHTHASAGFLLLWLHRILTCETRMVFRHTPLLFPHLSSLSKLLHRTVKHLVLTCDTATQHPLKFKLRKTKTLTLWRRRWTLVSRWQLEAAAQRSARWVLDNFTACSNAFEYLRNYPQPGTCKAAIKLKDTTVSCCLGGQSHRRSSTKKLHEERCANTSWGASFKVLHMAVLKHKTFKFFPRILVK